jgi:hypothetical protein
LLGAGCALSPDVVRRIEGEPGQEGTGIMFTKLPRAIKILATYEATAQQRAVVEARAGRLRDASRPGGASRYLAIDTAPDERGRGTASVMLWDTQTEEIVGNNVYDVEVRPKAGEIALWETYTAHYVGTGQVL